jgi:catechol 2,3-dioxygenase-like lactoylglutathione lyase family enzyme
VSIQLNHTIVPARDPRASASFLAEILGRAVPHSFGPFYVVSLDNGVALDYMHSDGDIQPQHYAFMVTDTEFDAIFDRIRARELPYWADPGHQQRGAINHRDGGRGLYWDDPDGHYLELMTRPYRGRADSV